MRANLFSPCAAALTFLTLAGCSRDIPKQTLAPPPAAVAPPQARTGTSLDSLPPEQVQKMLNDPKTSPELRAMLMRRQGMPARNP